MIVLRQHYNFQLHAELYSVADIMTGGGGGQFKHRFLLVGLCCCSMHKQKTTKMQKVGHQNLSKTQQLLRPL